LWRHFKILLYQFLLLFQELLLVGITMHPWYAEVWFKVPTTTQSFVTSSRCQFHQHFMGSFFMRKCFLKLLLFLQFAFVIFWQKIIGAKAVCIMLMKLSQCVSFTNIFLSSSFVQKCYGQSKKYVTHFCQFSYLASSLCDIFKNKFLMLWNVK